MDKLTKALKKIEACPQAIRFVKNAGSRQKAWNTCTYIDWYYFLLVRLAENNNYYRRCIIALGAQKIFTSLQESDLQISTKKLEKLEKFATLADKIANQELKSTKQLSKLGKNLCKSLRDQPGGPICVGPLKT